MRGLIALAALVALVTLGLATGATAAKPPQPDVLCGSNDCTGGGPGNPYDCFVQANNVHWSTSSPGQVSADGKTECDNVVDVVKSQTQLLKFNGGSWTPVGDQDYIVNVYSPGYKVTSTSKQPCVPGEYGGASWGYAAVGSAVYVNGWDYNFGPNGAGTLFC